MTEPVSQPTPMSAQPAVDATDPEVARKNMAFGWALFGLFWVLFGGTFAVAYIYLWLS